MRYASIFTLGVTFAAAVALVWRTKWAGRQVVALFSRGDR